MILVVYVIYPIYGVIVEIGTDFKEYLFILHYLSSIIISDEKQK